MMTTLTFLFTFLRSVISEGFFFFFPVFLSVPETTECDGVLIIKLAPEEHMAVF